jgi:hypothetical protein
LVYKKKVQSDLTSPLFVMAMRDQREPGYAMAVLGSAKSCLVQLRNAFSTMEGQRGCTTEGAHHYPNLFLFWGEINHLGCFGLPTGQEIGHNHKRPEPEVLEVQ